MAKTKAKKKREHIVRNGGRDVTKSRGVNMSFSTHERKTKTKQESIMQKQIKHKKRSLQHIQVDEGAFFIAFFGTRAGGLGPMSRKTSEKNKGFPQK